MKIIEFWVKYEISFALAIQFTQFFKMSIAYDTCIKTVGLQQPLPNNLVYLFSLICYAFVDWDLPGDFYISIQSVSTNQ